jgi:hypothetical protein
MRAKSSAFTVCVVVSILAVAPSPEARSTPAGRPAEDSPQRKIYQRTGEEGTLIGNIYFEGRPPERKFISMAADAYCDQVNPDAKSEEVLIRSGKVANVFVYVKGAALDGYAFETPEEEAVIERLRCQDVPHVIAIRTGQTLSIRNGDATSHNYNLRAERDERLNFSMPPFAPPVQKIFTRDEQFIPLRCNQHPWEKAYIGVFNHPFFAVSNRSGLYVIEGAPPGTYTLVAWHEKFGEQSLEVKIKAGDHQKIDFTFRAPPGNHYN